MKTLFKLNAYVWAGCTVGWLWIAGHMPSVGMGLDAVLVAFGCGLVAILNIFLATSAD